MPFTIPEAIEDLAPLLSLVTKISTGVNSLPPAATRKMADIGVLIAAVVPDLAALIDLIEAQAKS